MTYSEWIENYVASQPNRFVRGMCDDATKKMVEVFPELRRAAGFIYTVWGREQHWWCVTPDGDIVDPTASQYPMRGDYEELDLSRPEDRNRVPVGKCLNCGQETFRSSYSYEMCSEACCRSFETDLMSDLHV